MEEVIDEESLTAVGGPTWGDGRPIGRGMKSAYLLGLDPTHHSASERYGTRPGEKGCIHANCKTSDTLTNSTIA